MDKREDRKERVKYATYKAAFPQEYAIFKKFNVKLIHEF